MKKIAEQKPNPHKNTRCCPSSPRVMTQKTTKDAKEKKKIMTMVQSPRGPGFRVRRDKSPGPVARVVHEAGVGVPTLRLTSKESLAEAGTALLLQMLLRLHSRLEDARVRKIY
jgi:hypothetical protein